MFNPFIGKHGPLLIAEIGGNHEGRFEYAIELTNQAIEADVDIIKFQIYTGTSLVNPKESPDRFLHFQSFELSKDQHIQLATLCIDNGVQYSASVWDESVLNWIDPYIQIYKIGSGDLTAYPFLKSISSLEKPIILSTGLSTLEEIQKTVSYIINQNPIYENPSYLAILQCTSLYPNKYENVNLNVITSLKRHFQYPIGYSDHTLDSTALRVATVMGAQILEFHFTDTRIDKVFRDHHISLTKKEVKDLICDLKTCQTLLGSTEKGPLPEEIADGHIQSFRRAVYPNIDLKAGTKIKQDHLTVLRPNHGIDARDFHKLIGRIINRDINEFEVLQWSDFK